jgi:hypothetical protein
MRKGMEYGVFGNLSLRKPLLEERKMLVRGYGPLHDQKTASVHFRLNWDTERRRFATFDSFRFWWNIKVLRSLFLGSHESAVRTLGTLRDRRAIEPILKVLSDKSEDLDARAAAAEVLWKFRDKRVIEALCKSLCNETEDFAARLKFANILGKLGDRSAVEPLIATLADKHEYVRSEAAQVLGRLGDKRAVDLLIKTGLGVERLG